MSEYWMSLQMALILSGPIVIAGVLHMAAVKWNWLSVLNRPLYERGFGKNKTVRGLVLMPLFTLTGIYLFKNASVFQSQNWLELGFLLGFAYVLFELPNSFIKRRLGIAPGKRPNRFTAFFVITDQADSVLGCLLVYKVLLDPSFLALLSCALIGPLIHLAVNLSLHGLGFRNERF